MIRYGIVLMNENWDLEIKHQRRYYRRTAALILTVKNMWNGCPLKLLNQPFVQESPAKSRFQVFLKEECFVFVVESNIRDQLNGPPVFSK
jgi:hypothetical protein